MPGTIHSVRAANSNSVELSSKATHCRLRYNSLLLPVYAQNGAHRLSQSYRLWSLDTSTTLDTKMEEVLTCSGETRADTAPNVVKVART